MKKHRIVRNKLALAIRQYRSEARSKLNSPDKTYSLFYWGKVCGLLDIVYPDFPTYYLHRNLVYDTTVRV
jgi:hypothetical protein